MELEFLNLINNKKNNKKKEGIPVSKIWSQRTSIHPIELQNIIENDDIDLDYAYSLLFTDNRDIYRKNPTYKRKQVHKKNKLVFLKHISGESEKILNEIYTKMNYMKDKTEDLNKLNTLGMQKTSKTYFRTNRPKSNDISNGRKKRNQSASTYNKTQTINFNLSKSKSFTNNRLQTYNDSKNISNFNNLLTPKKESNNLFLFTNENTKVETKENANSNFNSFKRKLNISSSFNKNRKSKILLNYNENKFPLKINLNYKFDEKSDLLIDEGEEKFRKLINMDVEKLYSKNKKKKLNLSRLNNEYRLQINKSFNKYKSKKHLKELNKFQIEDMSVRKDIEIVKSQMNQKINDRCQGQYFKKQYLKLKNLNEKSKRAKSFEKDPFPVQIPYNILFRNTNKIKNVKVNPHGYKIRAYYDYCTSCEKMQNLQNKDLLEFGANLIFGHLKIKDYKLLNNTLDELFNLLETEPIIKYIDYFKNKKPNKDKDELNERIKNYFPSFIETEKKIQKINKNRKSDNENVLDKIDDIKNSLNKEIKN